MSLITQAAIKRVALAAAATALCAQGAFAAVSTKTVNDGYLTTSIITAPALRLLGVSVKGTGTTTSTGGLLSPTVYDFPITAKTGTATSLTGVTFGGAGLSFAKGTKTAGFSDLSFDFASKTLYGKNGSSNVALLKGSSISGGLVNGSFSYTVGGLGLTTASANLIGSTLGTSGTLLGLVPFGSLVIKAVPEPSTYALLGLGLAGAAFVARRRAAA